MTVTAPAEEKGMAMPATPHTDTKAEAVAWLVTELRAGRDPQRADVATRFGVSPRTAQNYRAAAERELDGSSSGKVVSLVPVPVDPRRPSAATVPAVVEPRPEPAPPVAAARPAAASPAAAQRPAAARDAATAPATPAATPVRAESDGRQAGAERGNAAPAATPVPGGKRDGVVAAATAAVVGVVIVAAANSYDHMRELAVEVGEPGWRAAMLPLSVDGLVGVASAVMLTRRRAGRPGGYLAGAALTLGIVASLAANVVSADPTLVPEHVVRWAVAGWSPLSLALSFELLLQLRAERSRGGAEGDGAEARPSVPTSQADADAGDSPETCPSRSPSAAAIDRAGR